MAENDVVERAKAELRRRKAVAELQRRQSMAPDHAAADPNKQAFDYSVLPLHADADGHTSFSSDAGILGGLKRSMMLGGDVMSGDVPVTDASGRTSDELIGRSLEAATTFSPSGVALGAGERMIPGVSKNLAPAEEALSADALKATAREGYEGAQNLGVEFSPGAVKSLSENTLQDLFSKGFVDETAPRTNSLLKRVGDVPVAAADETVTAPLASVEAARRGLNNAARNFNNPADAEAARVARQKLDTFLREPPEGAVLSGDAQAASQLYREADKNWAAAKKSDLLTGVEDAAELRAAAANSGQNAGNTTRQRIASVLLNNKTASRFAPDEKAALESVVKGNLSENASRYIANLLGGGGGLGQSLTALGTGGMAVAASGQPMALAAGAIPAVAGALLKRASNSMTQRRLGDVEEAIRAKAPASRDASKDIPAEVMRERAKELVMRALMAKQAQQPDQQFWDAYTEGNAF